ncbi:ethanolamine ammonia-lyase reactivating factor EutA, partial [Dehalococcoidia bacterium]|nr:ethanolamine ammonia-lyase reactivating factor EutA [Dehalococcoidia bacterium]
MATDHNERLRPEDVPPTELVELLSVGIDIGTATSHLVFSKLMLVRLGISMSSRYVVANRECLYESDILLTPYIKGTTIDADALKAFISEAYRLAGVDRSQVDTGALILTGEAVKKRNAKAIAGIFAEEAGRLVAVTAGDSLEAMMTAHGSGAVEMSKHQQNTIMSVDTGGGTSKLAIINKGQVIETAVISVGARLIVVDDDGIVNRLEEPGYWIGRELGLNLKVGRSVYKDRDGSESTSTMEDMA